MPINKTISHIKLTDSRQAKLDEIALKMPVPPPSRIYDVGLELLLHCSRQMVDMDDSIKIVLKALHEQ